MVRQFYGISQQSARQLGILAANPQGRKELSEVVEKRNLQTFHICKLTEAAPVAATDEVSSAGAQLYNWTPYDTTTGETLATASIGINGLNAITVWNPHDVEIPSGTLCFIAKCISGWIIVSPINWCPSNVAY